MPGPIGFYPNPGISAASEFANTIVGKKQVPETKKGPGEQFQLETDPAEPNDTPVLSRRAPETDTANLEEALRRQQQPETDAAEIGMTGAKRKWKAEPEEGYAAVTDDEAADESVETGDEQLDAASLRKPGQRRKRLGEEEEPFGAVLGGSSEEESTGQVFTATAANGPTVDTVRAAIEHNAEPQRIAATYNFATQQERYTPPVHPDSVNGVFALKNPRAQEALGEVRSLHLLPQDASIQPDLEPKGFYVPVPLMEEPSSAAA